MLNRLQLLKRIKQVRQKASRLPIFVHFTSNLPSKINKTAQTTTNTSRAKSVENFNHVRGMQIRRSPFSPLHLYPQIDLRKSKAGFTRFIHTGDKQKDESSDDPKKFNFYKIATSIILSGTAGWLTYKFNMASEEQKERLAIIKKLKNELEENWKKTNSLISTIPINEIQPLLQLFAKVDANEITHLRETIVRIDEQSALNDRLLYNIEQELSLSWFNKPIILANMKQDILSQTQRLKVYRDFCETFCYRKEKRFVEALVNVDKWIDDVIKYQKMISNDGKLLDFSNHILMNAYNHKAKIHRSLSGTDLDNLNWTQLLLSKANYEAALKISKHKVILSSLGFLLNDMSAMVADLTDREKMLNQALIYHKQAKDIDNQDLDIQHGYGYGLYKIEECHRALGVNINKQNLQNALDAFYVVEQKKLNARLYHDRGLTHLLNNDEVMALQDFNKGIELDPNHVLLRYERGNLLLQQGKIEQALEDLLRGRMVADTDTVKKKYDDAIQLATEKAAKLNNVDSRAITTPQQKAEPSEIPTPLPPTSSITLTKTDLEELDIRTTAKQVEFEKALKECYNYVKKLNPQIKAPKVFISYAWGAQSQEKWVERFATELEIAGFEVLLDRWQLKKGQDLMQYVQKVGERETDFVIVIGTHSYLEKYKRISKTPDAREPGISIEGRLIDYLTGYSRIVSEHVIPVILEGPAEKALPPLLLPKLYVDFWHGDRHREMLDLIRDMYNISQRDKEFQKIKDKFITVNKELNIREKPEIAKQYDAPGRQVLNAWKKENSMSTKEDINKVVNNISLPKPQD